MEVDPVTAVAKVVIAVHLVTAAVNTVMEVHLATVDSMVTVAHLAMAAVTVEAIVPKVMDRIMVMDKAMVPEATNKAMARPVMEVIKSLNIYLNSMYLSK